VLAGVVKSLYLDKQGELWQFTMERAKETSQRKIVREAEAGSPIRIAKPGGNSHIVTHLKPALLGPSLTGGGQRWETMPKNSQKRE